MSSNEQTETLIAQRDLELLHRAADEKLDKLDQQRLQALLVDSPAANALHADLKSLVDRLDHAKSIDPPEWLENTLFAQLDLPHPNAIADESKQQSMLEKLLPVWAQDWTPKAGLAWAVLLLTVGGIYQFSTGGIPTIETAKIVGTMVSQPRDDVLTLGHMESIDLPFLDGKLLSTIENGTIDLQFDLRGNTDSELRVRLANDAVNSGAIEFMNSETLQGSGQTAIESNYERQIDISTRTSAHLKLRIDNSHSVISGGIPISIAVLENGTVTNELNVWVSNKSDD